MLREHTLALTLAYELKHVFERFAEYVSNPERDLKRRGVFATLDRVDGLSRNPDLISEFLLCHTTLMKSEIADLIADVSC